MRFVDIPGGLESMSITEAFGGKKTIFLSQV